MPLIDIINGPNMNLLGTREPGIYGTTSLKEIETKLHELSREFGVEVRCFQSNHEGAIVDRIQLAGTEAGFIIINPAAYTHTSLAIRDALAAVSTPAIEVHLSNTHKREETRHHSHIADVVVGRIEGLGPQGYELALRCAADYLKKERKI